MADAAVVKRLRTQKRFNLPAHYRKVLRNGLTIVIREGYAESFEGFVMPEVAQSRHGDVHHRGRGRLISLPLAEGSNERVLVRRCIRGGILGRLLKETYLSWGTPRPLEELMISEYVRGRGIPTPQILAAAFERVSPFFYKGALAVREISPGADLQTELLAANRPFDSETLDKKRRTISSLGRLIAKMHGAGIYHADLHLKNLLLSEEGEGPGLYLLDLDAAKICDPISDFRRCANLLRLYRSADKVNRRGRVLTRTDLLRFLRSYAEESSQSARKLAGKLGGMLPLWRFKWKLSDMLGL